MADHVHEARVWLARPRPEVFAFLAEPANLVRLTPPGLRLRLLTPMPTLAAGAVLDFRLRWLGLPLRWRAYVREYDPPYRFVDVQVRGPWARWEHRHLFLEEGGGTWVEDRVTYRLPLGPLGRAVHAALVHRQLRALWAYRQRRLGELLGGPA
jgi:ligand-binding SRPBCC domain-containing protein